MIKSDLFNQFIEEEDIVSSQEVSKPIQEEPIQEEPIVPVQSESSVDTDKGEPFVDSANCAQYGIQVIDNFASGERLEELNDYISSQGLPLYIATYRSDELRLGKWEPLKALVDTHNWQLNHPFVIDSEWVSDHKQIISDLIEAINPVAKLNAHIIINPSTHENILIGGFHSNFPISDVPIYTAILYLNTNNGYTTFEDGFNVSNVMNRLLIFPSQLYYGTVSCTDQSRSNHISLDFVHSPLVMDTVGTDIREANKNE